MKRTFLAIFYKSLEECGYGILNRMLRVKIYTTLPYTNDRLCLYIISQNANSLVQLIPFPMRITIMLSK